MYQANPLPYEVDATMQNYSPEVMDEAIKQLGNDAPVMEEDYSLDLLDMPEQDGAMALDLEGQTSDLGSSLANPNGI